MRVILFICFLLTSCIDEEESIRKAERRLIRRHQTEQICKKVLSRLNITFMEHVYLETEGMFYCRGAYADKFYSYNEDVIGGMEIAIDHLDEE